MNGTTEAFRISPSVPFVQFQNNLNFCLYIACKLPASKPSVFLPICHHNTLRHFSSDPSPPRISKIMYYRSFCCQEISM